MHKRISIAAATVLVAALTFVAVTPANASPSYRTLGQANVRVDSTTTSIVIETLLSGQLVSIDCYVLGETISGTAIWDHRAGALGGYISDSLINTGSNDPVVPRCAGDTYDRAYAAQWALAHVNDTEKFDNHRDCTWFVSNALWAGRVPTTRTWNTTSAYPWEWASKWAPGITKAAAAADIFKNAIVQAGLATITEISLTDPRAGGAQIGDVIGYDWDNGADGFVDHVAIVTSIAADGTVAITQHSPARDFRVWNLDGNSAPLTSSTPGLRAYLLHITY